jgi:hypothetical protein
MAEVFRLYRETLPARRLDLDTDSPTLGEKSRQLEALAVAGESGVHLFLINRGDSAALTVTIDPALGRLAGGSQLIGASLSAEEATRITPAVNGNHVVLPPLSITRLRLD